MFGALLAALVAAGEGKWVMTDATQEGVKRCLQEITEEAFRDPDAFSDADLVACLDLIAAHRGGSDRVAADFRDELTRRTTERHTAQVEV